MRGILGFVFSRIFLCLIIIAAYLAAIIFLCVYIPTLMSFWAALAAAYAFCIIVAVYLANRKVSPDFKCAHLAFIAAFPVIGAVVCLFAVYRPKKCERTLHFKDKPIPPEVCYDECIYFKDGAEYFDRLFEEIDGAKRYVYLEYYIIAKGEIWDNLFRRLSTALARGIQVKIIADGLGSATRLPKKSLKELKRAGAQVLMFNKLAPFPLSRINFRDHRKIAVIDGKSAFLGGLNFADEYAAVTFPHGYWKDTGLAIYGRAAEVFGELFLSVFCGCRTAMPPPEEGQKRLLPFYDSPPVQRGLAEDLYCAEIDRAERRVWVFTPYLAPGERLFRSLKFAAERGVEVKIVIPHVPDKKLTFEISKSFAAELAESGVGIYEYTPGFMHAKSVICDGVAFTGSYNLDFRSMQLNYECGVRLKGEDAEKIASDFKECLALCERVSVNKPRLSARLFRPVLRLFAPLV